MGISGKNGKSMETLKNTRKSWDIFLVNNIIEATFGEFFGTELFITQQNLVNLNGGNVNKCQLLPSVSGLVVSTLTFILGKSLFGLSHLSSVDTASNQIGKVS